MWRSISLWSIYFKRKGRNVLELSVDNSYVSTGTCDSDKQKTEVIQYLYTKDLESHSKVMVPTCFCYTSSLKEKNPFKYQRRYQIPQLVIRYGFFVFLTIFELNEKDILSKKKEDKANGCVSCVSSIDRKYSFVRSLVCHSLLMMNEDDDDVCEVPRKKCYCFQR